MTKQLHSKQRALDLEILRIIAAFFVVFNHTGSSGFFLFAEQEIGSPLFWIYSFFSVACKVGVPLFFAISGAVLLSRTETLKELYLHRVLRIVLCLLVFSMIYYLFDVAAGREQFSLSRFSRVLYSQGWLSAFWFLYAYIAFLICLPFLRALVQKLEDRYFLYMIILNLVFVGIIPIAEYLIWKGELRFNSSLKLDFYMSNVIVCPSIGYYLYHRCTRKRKPTNLLLLWILTFCSIAVCCYMTYYKAVLTGECNESASQTFYGCFLIIPCIALFVTARHVFASLKPPAWVRKSILSLSSCTFGIYLLHRLFSYKRISVSEKLWALIRSIPHLDPMIATFIVCICTMIICYGITLVLKKIPGIKKLV